MARGGRTQAAAAAASLVKDPLRYKTELCANWARIGACGYDSKCQFAHGFEELRMRQDQPTSYKTKECREYERTGQCAYGPRCRFMHGDAVEAQHLAAMRLAEERRGFDSEVIPRAYPATGYDMCYDQGMWFPGYTMALYHPGMQEFPQSPEGARMVIPMMVPLPHAMPIS